MLLFCSVSADVQCRVEDETKPNLIGNAKNSFSVKWLSEIFLLRNAEQMTGRWQERWYQQQYWELLWQGFNKWDVLNDYHSWLSNYVNKILRSITREPTVNGYFVRSACIGSPENLCVGCRWIYIRCAQMQMANCETTSTSNLSCVFLDRALRAACPSLHPPPLPQCL